MTTSEYISIALACWIHSKIEQENDFIREGLPSIDVETFLRQLSDDLPEQDDKPSLLEKFSIAICGLGVNATEIQAIAHRIGLSSIREFADDLHIAAEWRNNREQHPRTIALAGNYNAGVHTLGHYARPASAELARALLENAKENLSIRFPGSPEVHRNLLNELWISPELELLLSLESCAEFLARWDALRSEAGNQAPLLALPALGLLMDRELFEANDLSNRLSLNIETTQQVRTLRSSKLHSLPRLYQNATRRKEITDAVQAVQEYLTAIQSGKEGKLSLNTARLVVRPPKDEQELPDSDTDPVPKPDPAPPKWTDEAADALVEGREEDLSAIADAIEKVWEDYEHDPTPEIEIAATLPSNHKEIPIKESIDRDMLEWIYAFCNESHWGGFLDTTETDLRTALRNSASYSPLFVQPNEAYVFEGEVVGLEAMLTDWDKDLPELAGKKTCLADTWREFQAVRATLLPHLGKLIYHARSWLDGRPQVLESVRRYLSLAAELYREVQENYRVMVSHSSAWAGAVLELLLSLDIVQVRVRLPNGKFAAKAVLLPTHPLHLWRNERLSTLLRGLAQSTSLGENDRKLLRKELERPEQFLSVVRLGSVPNGRGLNQLLPLTSSNDFAGLPVFENLINACSGSDGTAELSKALDQYILLHPNHPFPLRVALVNPPRPEALLLELVKLLKDPRYRGGQKLSAVDASIYATSQHADRLRAALSFGDTRKEDEVQEQVASGRLRLHIEESCLTSEPELHDIVEMIRKRPCHVAAIFDESTIRLRSRGARKNLPMSPFCVRYEIQIDQHLGNIELRPQPGESPFSEFLLLMNELEGHQRDATPHAYADAESLAKTTDIILRGERPAASWLFLADRALPPEAGMESVRIWERRSGMRDTFLATRDFNALARLIRPAFARCNLTVTPEHMTRLLHKGARLLGSGLLEIIKRQDGSPDTKKVTGFVGLLLAAWDFQRRHPGALVMSVDHPLARLWLRTGSQISGERCDLLVLWRDPANGEFSMIAAEVKTSDGDHLNNESTRHAEAVTQIQHTLEALQDGLAAAASAQSSPLSIPRCEMLKHTLVRAALARSGDAAMDRNNRKRYGAWLAALFPQEDKPTPTVQLSGCVVSVMLRRATAGGVEEKLASEPWPLLHRTLGEQDVEELLAWEVDTKTVPIPSVAENEGDIKNEVIPVNPPAKPVATVATQSWTPKQPIPSATGTTSGATPAAHPAQSDKQWPPAVNQLGMIGQYREVDLLVKQAVFAKTMGQRFSDKLLVGPAGVGKSTLARKIGELLLNREPVFCNGADLRKPADLLERLRREGLVPDDSTGGTLAIAPSLVFIDEVHGIGILAATTLLSAMDDRRTTTIDGRLYDFNPVIFLLATTDQGKLSEAFQSRPDKTSLRPYTLHELAGIVWLHGKECLDGSELPKESCYEIAARTRCSPRRSVRDLSEILRPHFFHQAMESQSDVPTLRQVAELMTCDNIAAFYQGQGIDGNGLDDLAWRYLNYLKLHITASEVTLMQGLGLADRRDFNEATEYLARLGLIETSSGGRRLTRDGTKYLNSNPPPDLRDRISRAM